MPIRLHPLLILALLAPLAACTTLAPPAAPAAAAPPSWQAPLPHGGSLQALSDWWTQLDDPLLTELITAAQAASPGVAQARSRIEQARAAHVASRAALGPTLDGQASASRGFSEQVGALAGTAQAGLQARWELDLFGAGAAAQDAARQRLAGAQALWHEARVSVAAEVATQLSSVRTCAEQAAVAERDARSRAETARLTDLTEGAGFTAPATAALARASAAEALARASQQRMQCDLELKALVALTAWAEPTLRARLTATPGRPAPDALFAVPSVPAAVLAQRPDLYNAEREVAAARAEILGAEADRYPRLSLSGSVAAGSIRTGGQTLDVNTWSIGPLALTIPIFDGGRRQAQLEAAQARYTEAAALYQARARQAVSEVEQALVRLASTAERKASAEVAARGYRASYEATEARWRGGLASLVELEDARRTSLAAETALLGLFHERQLAWVALYRAAGGGWTPDAAPPMAAAPAGTATAASAAAAR